MNEITIDREEKSKNKTVGRISRLFQKKPKKKSVASSISSLSLSDPALSKQTTASSIASSSHLSIPPENSRNSSLEFRHNANMMHSNNANDNETASIQQKLTRNMSLSRHQSPSIQQQLQHQRQLLQELDFQKSQLQSTNAQLTNQLEKAQEKIRQRTNDMTMLQTNYQQHLRSVRSSDDDPSSIAVKLLELRRQIHELASELLPHAEPITTTEKLGTLWLNLGPAIEHLGKPLPPKRIQLLTEKFMMDVLVQNLNINIFPGLSCNNEFLELQTWFDQHDTSSFFSTRLRQELSLVVIQQQNKGQVAATLKKCVDRNWHHLYRGLQKAYPTYLANKDGASADEQSVAQAYSKKLRGLVEYTVGLGSAIKGQEVCITAVDVREGKQSFDAQLMEDEDGQTSGVIAFCISPPFVVKIANQYEPLVKGRVLCFPINEPTTDNIP